MGGTRNYYCTINLYTLNGIDGRWLKDNTPTWPIWKAVCAGISGFNAIQASLAKGWKVAHFVVKKTFKEQLLTTVLRLICFEGTSSYGLWMYIMMHWKHTIPKLMEMIHKFCYSDLASSQWRNASQIPFYVSDPSLSLTSGRFELIIIITLMIHQVSSFLIQRLYRRGSSYHIISCVISWLNMHTCVTDAYNMGRLIGQFCSLIFKISEKDIFFPSRVISLLVPLNKKHHIFKSGDFIVTMCILRKLLVWALS